MHSFPDVCMTLWPVRSFGSFKIDIQKVNIFKETSKMVYNCQKPSTMVLNVV